MSNRVVVGTVRAAHVWAAAVVVAAVVMGGAAVSCVAHEDPPRELRGHVTESGDARLDPGQVSEKLFSLDSCVPGFMMLEEARDPNEDVKASPPSLLQRLRDWRRRRWIYLGTKAESGPVKWTRLDSNNVEADLRALRQFQFDMISSRHAAGLDRARRALAGAPSRVGSTSVPTVEYVDGGLNLIVIQFPAGTLLTTVASVRGVKVHVVRALTETLWICTAEPPIQARSVMVGDPLDE